MRIWVVLVWRPNQKVLLGDILEIGNCGSRVSGFTDADYLHCSHPWAEAKG